MAAWYATHINAAASGGGSEDATLELWELLRSPGAVDATRLNALAARVIPLPWNAHLQPVFADAGWKPHLARFGAANGLPTPSPSALLAELAARGTGADPMPFPSPTFRPCETRAQQRVSTGRGTVTMDYVLATEGGQKGYGLVKNLQTCIYGKVRHAVELEAAPTGSRGGLFSALSGGDDAKWRATDRQVAIKCIERRKYEAHVARHAGKLNEDPIKEVAVMDFIRGRGGAPFVLPLLGCYADETTVYVILPLCPNGDLFGVVEQAGAGLPEASAATYMGQIVAGLERLHAMGLAHHDMSLENLLVDERSRAIIIDFGMAVRAAPTFSRFLPGGHERIEGAGPSYHAVPLQASRGWPCRCGKLLYMAPELFEPTGPFDVFAADVWALGIILFLLLTGMPPWDAATGPKSSDLRYVYVRDGRLRELLSTWNISLSEHAPDLLQRLLSADPSRRLTIPELKAHPWWRANEQYIAPSFAH